MAFQRSYSKFWWGSDYQTTAMSQTVAGHSFASGQQTQQHFQKPQPQLQVQQPRQQFGASSYRSLNLHYKKNLSLIQEVDDEQNISILSWEKHDSPGSLRSQDSGFSDNEETHSTKTVSPSPKSECSEKSMSSPTSVKSIATPPTVVRRIGNSEFYAPLVSVSRRISFKSTPQKKDNSAMDAEEEVHNIENNELQLKLDSMQLVEEQQVDLDASNSSDSTPTAKKLQSVDNYSKIRRRRVFRRPAGTPHNKKYSSIINAGDDERRSNRSTSSTSSNELDEVDRAMPVKTKCKVTGYNQQTVYLDAVPEPYNNETVILGYVSADETHDSCELNDTLSPLREHHKFTASTSTPKNEDGATPQIFSTRLLYQHHKYENPLLNGHAPSLQSWLDDMRGSYDQEVMSTLQTKSIAQEAFKNLKITTNSVTKLIRQLQQSAMCLQTDFERIEDKLSSNSEVATTTTLYEALYGAQQLIESVGEFTQVLQRRVIFFSETRVERKRYEDTIAQIIVITKDTHYSLMQRQYMNLDSLLDDVQLLRRYLLIAIRLVFERMVHVIVQSIEYGTSELMLRANINMVATLMNIEYEGFASLTEAFLQTHAVRALLLVTIESKSSSVRALALRALATICCVPAAIAQLSTSGGIEILRDILQVTEQNAKTERRSVIERREAVSLLTQITAAWHGAEHRVADLKDCAETIIAGMTEMIVETNCAQTLLLCAAALNNLSRIEVTSHYSIMSNETIFKLIEFMAKNTEKVTIFLYEQVVAMLHNMSLNKKCHSHLANGSIVNFITSAYQTEFYKVYESRAKSEAQRRTIKTILHTLTRLVHDSNLGADLLAQHHVPSFFKLADTNSSSSIAAGIASNTTTWTHSHDVSLLAQRLQLMKQQQAQELATSPVDSNALEVSNLAATTKFGRKFNISRQVSHV